MSDYRREKDAREQGARLLSAPENAWAREAVDLYLDVKDHYRGLAPGDLPPPLEAAFRAIRQGSGGRLGNPPAL